MNIATLKFLGLYYSLQAIKISELRSCHGNQKTIQPSQLGSGNSYSLCGINLEKVII